MKLAAASLGIFLAATGWGATDPPDILFIAVDDLRPALGCYGDQVAKTPHLDRPAESAVVFERAFCQVASSCPSRASVLTGLCPENTRVLTNGSPHFREKLPDAVTLPQHFKESRLVLQGTRQGLSPEGPAIVERAEGGSRA